VPVVNGASGAGRSVAEFAGLVVAAWGVDCGVGFSGKSRPGDPVNLLADVTKLRSLGFESRVPLEDGVRDYVAWFRRAAGR
jgi:UDP-glucose 4-epimerase